MIPVLFRRYLTTMNSTAEFTGTQPLILELLLGKGLLDPKKLEGIRQAQLKEDRLLEEVLVSTGVATDRDIAAAYSKYLSIPLFAGPEPCQADARQLASLLPEK